MKSVITAVCLLFVALLSFAQTAPPPALPAFGVIGASFNQIGTPKVNLFASAIYPTGSSTLEYAATTVNILPKVSYTAAGKKFYAFETATTESVFKSIYAGPKFTFLVGPGIGASFSQASPSGMNVNIAASFTGVPAFRASDRFSVAFPIQGIYTSGGWDLVPGVALAYRLGK